MIAPGTLEVLRGRFKVSFTGGQDPPPISTPLNVACKLIGCFHWTTLCGISRSKLFADRLTFASLVLFVLCSYTNVGPRLYGFRVFVKATVHTVVVTA